MNEEKSLKTKIITWSIIFVVGTLILWFLIALLFAGFLEMDHFTLSSVWGYFTKWYVLLITFGISLSIVFYTLYLKFFKSGSPSSRRSKSDVYDDSRFLTNLELDKKFGSQITKKPSPIKWNNIHNEVINGLLVNSYFDKKGEFCFHCASGVHSITIGTTGTGKTKFLLIPSVLMLANSKNRPSMVIIDIKGEILEKTKTELDKNGYKLHLINLRDVNRSERYNPLNLILEYDKQYLEDEIKYEDNKFRIEAEIDKIAMLMIPESKGDNAFWDQASQKIFKAIIYGMLEDFEQKKLKETDFTFRKVAEINELSPKEFREYFANRRSYKSRSYSFASGVIICNYEQDGSMNKTLSSMLSTYTNAFNKFISLAGQELTIKNDFDVRSINKLDHHEAIFLLLPDEEKSKYPLASMIVAQIYSILTYESQNANYQVNDVHFILDEFANLPKFPEIDTWLSAGRERKLFIHTFLQAISQLNQTYGNEYAKTIIQNSNLKVVLGLSENESVKYFVELFGTYTAVQSSHSEGERKDSGSSSSSFQKLDLVKAGQLLHMGKGEVFSQKIGEYPAHTHLTPIFNEQLLKLLNLEKFNLSAYYSAKKEEDDKLKYKKLEIEKQMKYEREIAEAQGKEALLEFYKKWKINPDDEYEKKFKDEQKNNHLTKSGDATDMDLAREKARKRHEQWLKYQQQKQKEKENEQKAKSNQDTTPMPNHTEEVPAPKDNRSAKQVADDLAKKLNDSGMADLDDPFLNNTGEDDDEDNDENTPEEKPKKIKTPEQLEAERLRRQRYAIQRKKEKLAKSKAQKNQRNN